MSIREKVDIQKLIIAGLLVLIGFMGRVLLHDFFGSIMNPFTSSNFPLDVFFVIATVSLFAGFLLGKYYALLVPVCIIALTDVFYAVIDPKTVAVWTTSLFLFTWSGYAVLALLGSLIKKKPSLTMKVAPMLFGAGVLGVLVYDTWTNFGFWLLYSKMGFYPQTLGGLATVFIGGVPSMIWHLLSASIAIIGVAIPLIYFKEHRILKKDSTIKPIEKYIIVGATAILISVSILSTLV